MATFRARVSPAYVLYGRLWALPSPQRVFGCPPTGLAKASNGEKRKKAPHEPLCDPRRFQTAGAVALSARIAARGDNQG